MGKKVDSKLNVKFGDKILSTKDMCKHMGVVLCSNNLNANDEVSRRIGVANSVINAARGLGSRNIPCDPQVLSKIYWTVAIPQMLYGYDVTPINSSGITLFENAHRKNSKLVQGLALDVPNPTPLANMGWISIDSYIAMIKMLFLMRTLCLPLGNLYREFVIRILKMIIDNQYVSLVSPISSMYEATKRIGIDVKIEQCLREGCNFGTYTEWKHLVKYEIKRLENAKWKSSCILYGQLSMYLVTVQNISIHVWWKISSKIPSAINNIAGVMSVIMGSQPRGTFCYGLWKLCPICDLHASDTVQHVLFECPKTKLPRDRKLAKLMSVMPPAMARSFKYMNAASKSQMVLSAYGCKQLIDEWLTLYAETASFICKMFVYRKDAYTMINEHVN